MSLGLPQASGSTINSLPLGLVNARTLAVSTDFNDSGLNYFNAPCLQHFDDVYILKHRSVIVDSDFNPIKSASNEHIYWHPSAMPSCLSADDLNKEVLSRFDKLTTTANHLKQSDKCLDLRELTYNCVFLMHPFEWYPYGHFLMSFNDFIKLMIVLSRSKLYW